MSRPTPRKDKRRRRWPLLVVLVAIAAAIVLATGVPQAWLVARIASDVLGTRVEAENVSLLHRVHAGVIRVYDHDATQPAVTLRDVGVELDFTNERMVKSLRIGTIGMALRATGEEANVGFIRDWLDRPRDPTASNRYLPEKIAIDAWNLDVQLEEMGLVLEDLAVEAVLTAPNQFAVGIVGDGIEGSHWFGSPETVQRLSGGAIDIFATRDDSGASVLADITLSSFLDIDADAFLSRTRGMQVWDVTIHDAAVEGFALGGLEGILIPFPVQFSMLTAENTKLRIRQGAALSLPGATLDIFARDLYAGPAESPWYGGDIAVRGSASFDRTVDANVAVTFDAGQTATLVAAGTVDAGTADVVIANWERADLVDAIPPAYRDRTTALPEFTGLSGNLALSWEGRDYTLDSDLTTGGDAQTLALEARGSGTLDESGPLYAGNATVRIGKGTAQITLDVTGPAAFEADANLATVDLNAWLRVALGDRTPALPEAIVNGRLGIHASDLSQRVQFTPRLNLTGLRLGERSLTDAAPLALSGPLEWLRESREVRAATITLDLPERTAVTVERWRHDIDGRTGEGLMRAHLELDWLEIGELWGHVDAEGPVTYTRTSTGGPITFTSTNLGWGNVAVPYGEALEGSGTFDYAYANRQLQLRDVTAALDDANAAQIALGTLHLNPMSGDLPLRVSSDLRPLVAMDLLDSAEANGTFEGVVTAGASQLQLRGNLGVQGARIVLPANRAVLSEVDLQSSLTYANAFAGEGTITAGAVTVSNVTITGATSPLRWEGQALSLPRVQGTAYAGNVDGHVRIGLLEEGRPLDAGMTFDDVDLQAFSDALAPDDFSMTGIARGTASVAIRNSVLADVQLDAHSDDGFTLSREMVRRILESPRYAGMLGRQLDKALNTILGTADQRPFDSAAVALKLQSENELQGQAVLKSEMTRDYRGLDLTVDLTVPVAGLAELMALAAGD